MSVDGSSGMSGAPRPVAATVFGWIGIVLGALGVLGGALAIGLAALVKGVKDPLVGLLPDPATYERWAVAMNLLGLAFSMLLLVAGIGLLRQAAWARIGMIVYGLYSLVAGPAGAVVLWVVGMGPALAAARNAADADQLMPGLVGGVLGLVAGTLIGIAHGVAILFFLTRPAFVAAYEGRVAPPPASGHPPSPPPGGDVIATIIPFRNRSALISYYLGLFSIFALVPMLGIVGIGMGIAAIVLGWKGLDYLHFHPEAKGKWHARTGIGCGFIWASLGLLIHALLIVGLLGSK